MNNLQIKQRVVKMALGMAGVMVVLTGCGGGMPEDETAHYQANQYRQTSGAAQRPDASSFTMRPAEEFKGFNHDVWNDKRAWYECDCGNTPQAQPTVMPWNTNS